MNRQYKQLANKHRKAKDYEGELVMAHLNKYKAPTRTHNKLQFKKFGPFQILKEINSNTYILNLPSDMKISATFNVSDLHPYCLPNAAPTQVLDLELNPLQEGGFHAGHEF